MTPTLSLSFLQAFLTAILIPIQPTDSTHLVCTALRFYECAFVPVTTLQSFLEHSYPLISRSMEIPRHVLPSNNYQPHQLSLDDHSSASRGGPRGPLTDSAGNSQYPSLGSVSSYHDKKDFQTRVKRPMYQTPTVPSSHNSMVPVLERQQRQQHNRRRKQQNFRRNPIEDSVPYKAYRARQNREGNAESDQKWPYILETAFLDGMLRFWKFGARADLSVALIDIPRMGRRKYSYRGKPHGRNELISEYLWIAYLESLQPGRPPDPTMARGRKQVSSHIQVLKTFFKEHPACKTAR